MKFDLHLTLQWRNFLPIYFSEEEGGQDHSYAFSDEEAPPDVVDVAAEGEKPGNRDEYDELASEGND